MTLELTEPADAFGLPTWASLFAAERGCSQSEVTHWHEALERAVANHTFRYRIDFVITAGTVSSSG
jgi:hypothetical protein